MKFTLDPRHVRRNTDSRSADTYNNSYLPDQKGTPLMQ